MDNNFNGGKKKKSYSKNGNFYIYTLLCAVVLCLLIGLLAYNATVAGNTRKPNNSNKTVNTEVSEKTEVTDFSKPENLITSTGLIEKIDNNVLYLYDITDDKNYQLGVDSATVINDKYSKPLILAELFVGDIVDFTFPESGITLTEVQKNTRAWEQTRINVQYHDNIEKILTINSKDYKYSDNTMVEYLKGSYSLDNITPYDLITVSGYGDDIYFIKILKGHGTIEFVENEKIVDGVVELDTTDIIQFDALESIIVSEGAHKVVVKGSNINPYTEDVFVEANGISTVDLTKIVTKKGLFIPTVNVPEYTITIDNEVMPNDEPILLDYGVYGIKVEAEKYVGYEGTLNIKNPETQMRIDLTERVMMKKIEIRSSPVGADIFVDSAFVGKSPVTQEIIFGQHTLTAKLDGYIDLVLHIEVNEDTRSGVDFTLTRSENIIPTEVSESENVDDVESSESSGSSLFGN